MNDIELIYDKLKDKYDLVLTSTMALDDGYTIDVPVICGASEKGRFDLYKDESVGLFVFSVAPEKTEKHWHTHAIDMEGAIRLVDGFMGKK